LIKVLVRDFSELWLFIEAKEGIYSAGLEAVTADDNDDV